MKHSCALKLFISWLSCWLLIFTHTTSRAETEAPVPLVTLPVLDLPFNMTDGGFIFPSMRQSLEISTGFYQTAHAALGKSSQPDLRRRVMILIFDLVTLEFPLSSAWMHEEWHRAVLGHRHIGSFNDTYNFPLGQGLVAVSHVDDDSLTRLKRDFPADQVRLNAAGIESQYEQTLLIEKREFFYGSKSWNKLVIWMNSLNNILYLNTCASGDVADASTRKQNDDDGANVGRRDFTGLDCTAWAYDLFRPGEAYQARGVHPSGVGINRYRKYSDLNEDEKSFLKTQAALSFLNLMDPFLIDRDRFDGPLAGLWGDEWNFTLRHHITSFGSSTEGNIFLKSSGRNWLLKPQLFMNAVRAFPGASIELLRWAPWRDDVKLSPRLQVWLQPESSLGKSTTDRLGGLVAIDLAKTVSRNFEANFGIDAKTEGWVAGNVYLEPALSTWTGFTYLF